MSGWSYAGFGSDDPRVSGTLQHAADVSLVINDSDSVTVSVTGTGNAELIPPTGYVPVSGYSETAKVGDLLTVSGGQCVVGTLPSGDWVIKGDGYLDASHSSNNSHLGVVFGITRDSVTTLTPRTVHQLLPSQADIGNLCGRGTITGVQSGDLIDVHLASDNTGTVDIHSSNVNFALYRKY